MNTTQVMVSTRALGYMKYRVESMGVSRVLRASSSVERHPCSPHTAHADKRDIRRLPPPNRSGTNQPHRLPLPVFGDDFNGPVAREEASGPGTLPTRPI